MTRCPFILVLFFLAGSVGGCLLEPGGDPDNLQRVDIVYPRDGSTADGTGLVCEPGEATCEDLKRKICGSQGDGWLLVDCPPGAGCVADGRCELAHPRVAFVFDTSSSMLVLLGPGSGEIEECGDAEPAGSVLAASKQLFRTLFQGAMATEPRMALFRFPQSGHVVPDCEAAAYVGRGVMSGDDGDHLAPGSASGWFLANLPQTQLVPFPADPEEDGRFAIVRWLDGVERVLEGTVPCVADADCTSGFCAGGTCGFYDQPELRASGNTPLGRTIFYVGEYFRHRVFVDGDACSEDADCDAPGYRCNRAGRCVDPLETCRSDHIVVFTDGYETNDDAPDNFFNPYNQARRLRYGLGCESDRDCLAGATCGATQTCVVPGEPPLSESAWSQRMLDDIPTLARYVDPEGIQVLRRGDGRPTSIQVHVLDVFGNTDNALLAWFGGGEYVTGSFENPQAVLAEMNLIFESKGSSLVCEPTENWP